MGPIPEPYANTTITSFPKLCRLVNFCHTELLALQETPLFVGKEARFPVDFSQTTSFCQTVTVAVQALSKKFGPQAALLPLDLGQFWFPTMAFPVLWPWP